MNDWIMRYPGWTYVFSQLLNALLFAATLHLYGCAVYASAGLSREQQDLLRISEVCATRYKGYVVEFSQRPELNYKVLCKRRE